MGLMRRANNHFLSVLFECIKDGLQHLAAGTKCSLYIPHLPWDGVERVMGLSSACAHLHSQEPSDSLGRTRDGSRTNGEDYSELVKKVVNLLEISIADFSPELPLTAYGLSSLTATRISQVVRPYASVSQVQLLGGLSWKQLEERIKEQSIRGGSVLETSELLKQVVDLLDVSMADFSPELPFTAYGLSSLGATRISQVVRPYASVSQMQLLGGLGWKQLEERIKTQSIGESTVLEQSPVDDVLEMVARYSNEFSPHTGTEPLPSRDIVLVTGTTGTIGSNVLAQLVADPKVGKVYALNRDASTPLDARQRVALGDRGLDPSVINSLKVVLLEGTVSQPKLGLADGLFEELRASVTHVIHLGEFFDYHCVYAILTSAEGWRVDTNVGVAAFEDDIKGIRNLIDLALSSSLSSPPHFLFISSPAVLHSMCCSLCSSITTHSVPP